VGHERALVVGRALQFLRLGFFSCAHIRPW
jgi:hypothetical protein